MTKVMSYPAHLRAVAALGLPLVGGHLAQFAIGLTDTVMLGWYGVEELAAVTLASSYFFVLFLMGSGFGWAVMPMVAAAQAEDDQTQIRRVTRMGLWWSLIFATLCMPLFWYAHPILLALGQEPDISAIAAQYLRLAGWGIYPALLVVVMKSYLAALERTQIVLWITIAAAVANGLANYALIFGHWGAPELGVTGAAVASLTSHAVALVAICAYGIKVLPEHSLFQRFWRPDPEAFVQVVRLGVPIGLTSLSEVVMFSASAVMIGWLGAVPLAAHGIALQLSAATFMVHVGLSNAATVRAGNAWGRRDLAHLRRGAIVVTAMSLVVAALGSALFLLAPEFLVGAFMDHANPARAQILQAGVALLAVAALFQTMDGMQVIALGLLRGQQDTGVPMVMAAVSYIGVGLPGSYVLGFVLGWGAVGVWSGLVLGLACAALLLMTRFWQRLRRQLLQAAG